MAELTEEETIERAERVERLLNDDAVQAALADLDRQYWKEAKASKSDDKAGGFVAKARALEDLQTKLQAVVDAGRIATAARERRKRTTSR